MRIGPIEPFYRHGSPHFLGYPLARTSSTCQSKAKRMWLTQLQRLLGLRRQTFHSSLGERTEQLARSREKIPGVIPIAMG